MSGINPTHTIAGRIEAGSKKVVPGAEIICRTRSGSEISGIIKKICTATGNVVVQQGDLRQSLAGNTVLVNIKA